jgi:pullulanase/glycogen debranching enzyme
VDYNGSPAGYTKDPQEDISYVSAHDNQTLFDVNIFAAPQNTSLWDRVRMQIVGLSTVLLGEGVPFIHAGSDLLRSKSLDRNSYDSGDWFNRLDFTFHDNNFGAGLPPEWGNSGDWPVMQPFLADPGLKPNQEQITRSAQMFSELLSIRYSSRLFRLGTEAEIQERVKFLNTGPNQLPGLIVMALSDEPAPNLDPNYRQIVVLINANDEAQTFTDASFAGKRLNLHPVQSRSLDPVVRTAAFDRKTGAFTIPARTAVVFVENDVSTNSLRDLLEAAFQKIFLPFTSSGE